MGLIAFLALEPGPHSRDELTALLWGEFPEEKANASLRHALSELRLALHSQLRIDRSAVELDPAVPCDVTAFLRIVGSDPETALRTDIPRFFSGVNLKHCRGFEDWLESTRRTLLGKYCFALDGCTRSAAARRDWRRTAELAATWLRIDPISDDAAHHLVEAQYLAGDESAALASYREFTAHLGAAEERLPNLGLRELAKRIESGRPRVPTREQDDSWYIDTSGFGGALVGREREWEAMVRAWSEVQRGRSRFVMVEGAAGVGKTRLTDDFCRWARAQGGSVLRSRAYEAGAAVPFASMLEILRAVLDLPGISGTDPSWLAEASRVLPEVRRRFPAIPEPRSFGGSSLLFEAVSELLLSAAVDHPIVALIDDLQWCDPDSCAMVHYLVRRLEQAPVLWCFTLTLGTVDRDAAAARLARALRAAPGAARLELAPLSAEQVWAMIRELGRINAATGGSRLASRVHEVTGGNPFYVIELLKTLFAEGWLTVHPESREWIVTGLREGEQDVGIMSPTVQEAIAHRIARLPDDHHAILMAIALVGAGCRTAVLSHVHGISRLRAATLADDLVERYLAVEDGGVYRCAHPVIASVVRAEMSTARRREIHRALALALIAVAESGEPVDPGEVARHAEEGGEPKLAYDHALTASRASRDRGAYEEALAWLDLASTCAAGAEQTATVDRATAGLLDEAGWPEPPSSRRGSGSFAVISRGDFDLPGA